MGRQNLTQKHVGFEESQLERLEEIADREGRKETDLIREAVNNLVVEKEESTHGRVIDTAPQDGLVFQDDAVGELNFAEVWANEGGLDELSHGSIVRSIEPGRNYFDNWTFRFDEENYPEEVFVCQMHARFSIDYWEQVERRIGRYF